MKYDHLKICSPILVTVDIWCWQQSSQLSVNMTVMWEEIGGFGGATHCYNKMKECAFKPVKGLLSVKWY